jgi:hypothetical protein
MARPGTGRPVGAGQVVRLTEVGTALDPAARPAAAEVGLDPRPATAAAVPRVAAPALAARRQWTARPAASSAPAEVGTRTGIRSARGTSRVRGAGGSERTVQYALTPSALSSLSLVPPAPGRSSRQPRVSVDVGSSRPELVCMHALLQPVSSVPWLGWLTAHALFEDPLQSDAGQHLKDP